RRHRMATILSSTGAARRAALPEAALLEAELPEAALLEAELPEAALLPRQPPRSLMDLYANIMGAVADDAGDHGAPLRRLPVEGEIGVHGSQLGHGFYGPTAFSLEKHL